MDKLRTNVLIIGKSGVGKSSLLNYLFDREKQETGSGRPVTKEGIFPFEYQYDDFFTINIYDTWGLEPDKAEKWRDLIMEEVEQHDKQDISQWFNTIIYCLNANSNIVEDFEIENMKALIKEKNNIVVVLTHCNHEKGEMLNHMMRDRVMSDAKIPEENILHVNSVSQRMIGGIQEEQFGREEVFAAIIQNLWKQLKGKVPYRVKINAENQIAEFRNDLLKYIDTEFWIIKTEKKYEKFDQHVMLAMERLSLSIDVIVNKKFKEAIDYYNSLSNKYASIAFVDSNNLEVKIGKFKSTSIFEEDVNRIISRLSESKSILGYEFSLFKDDVTKENIHNLLIACKEVFTSSRKVKRELKDLVEKFVFQAHGTILKEINRIEKNLGELDIEGISKIQIDAKD